MINPIQNGKKSADRAAGGRFAIGNKESPGRPPGRGIVAEMREKLGTDLDKMIVVLKGRALAGDAQAIRIILDRVMPTLRPVDVPTALSMPKGGNLAEQAQAVVRATANGDLTPSQAAQIVGALGSVAKIIETTELLARVAALEARNPKGRV